MKLKSFCKAKDTVNRIKQEPTDLEKNFTNPLSDRGLISKIYKELKKLDTNKPNNPIKKWGKERILNRGFTNGWLSLKCSISLVIREMQIKMTL